MNLHIFSDLHADTPDTKPIAVLPEVEVIVVAGDVCEGVVLGFERLREMVLLPTPIVAVMGNHEHYHRALPDGAPNGRRNSPISSPGSIPLSSFDAWC